jgi:hypothetical protein
VSLMYVDVFMVPQALWKRALVSGKAAVVRLLPNYVHVSGLDGLFLPEGCMVWEEDGFVFEEGFNVIET